MTYQYLHVRVYLAHPLLHATPLATQLVPNTLRSKIRTDFCEVYPQVRRGTRTCVCSGKIKSMATKNADLLVYGATGHTGQLVAAKLKECGIIATLAGRNAAKLKEVSESAGGLPYEAFDLTDSLRLNQVVAAHKAVLHIAGPFTVTSPPMLEACLKNGTHYMDVTGETKVIEEVQRRGGEAKEKGVMLMSAVGFDCVPGDCLAGYLKDRLPSATHLDLASFIVRNQTKKDSSSSSSVSKGTLLSALFHIIPHGGYAKRNGAFVKEAIGKKSHTFDLGDGGKSVPTFSFPAAELPVVSHTTDIANITTFFPGTSSLPLWVMSMVGPGVMNSYPVKKAIEYGVSKLPTPVETKSSDTRMYAAAEVRDEKSGERRAAAISVGPGYLFTASAAVEIARRVVGGEFKAGYQTPVSAYGWKLANEIPGERVEIIDVALSEV